MAAADKLKELFGDRLTEQDCNNLISHGFGSPEALLDDAQRICLEDSLVSQGAIKVVLAWQAEHLRKCKLELQWAAFYLALGTKAVNKLGFLSYLWASIVILGGFASDIKIHDYVMITLTLVFEATRWYSWLGMVALNHGTNKEPTTGYLEMRPAKTATIFYFLRGSSILAKVVITTVWFSLNGYKTSSVTLSFAMFTYFVVLYLQFIVFLLHNEMYGWWYQTWYDKKETLAKLDQHWMSFYYTAYFIAANGNIFDCFNVSEPFYSKYKAYYIPDAWNLLPSIADELISKLCKGRASGSA